MRLFSILSLLVLASSVQAQVTYNPSGKSQYTDFENDTLQLERVEVTGQGGSRLKLQHVTANTEIIGAQQLVRAACCNLGESFTTNPSVDVNYSDAATGARQIKLLGLSGTYVQMLTENVPNLRGAAIPFGLGYIPGPWMQSIQVSKGASSVRNGFESTTGQINVEYLKPQGVDNVSGNLYYDSQQKFEANVMAGIHANDRLSTSLLLHYEDRQQEHDGNSDGFMDMPRQRQYNGMWRWAYVGPRWISQFFVRALDEERLSGQSAHHTGLNELDLYRISINTQRYEAQWKNALILDPEHNASVALMLHGSLHQQEAIFGDRPYDVNQKNGYAQLMYETDLTERHNLALGASINHDYYRQNYNSWTVRRDHNYPLAIERRTPETTSGLYAQYTYKVDETFTAMAGLRYDNSSLWDGFFTPRLHLKYTPASWVTLRASAGKGYRTPMAMVENLSHLASGRTMGFEPEPRHQEEAWNYGSSIGFTLPLFGRDLELNAEYYYTDFKEQLVVDVRPSVVLFQYLSESGSDARSFSHTVQLDAHYPLFDGFDLTGGFRFSDARTTYDYQLKWRPLTARYKGMLSLSYKTPLELWQFDLTGQLIGPQRLYDDTRTPAYGQLSAQITREFHYFSLYLGGENLTGYHIKDPILNASQPWSPGFDATQVWGPTEGAMFYFGLRFKIEKY